MLERRGQGGRLEGTFDEIVPFDELISSGLSEDLREKGGFWPPFVVL